MDSISESNKLKKKSIFYVLVCTINFIQFLLHKSFDQLKSQVKYSKNLKDTELGSGNTLLTIEFYSLKLDSLFKKFYNLQNLLIR